MSHKPPFYCPATLPPDIIGVRRKKTYATYAAAQAANLEQRPYLCPHCKLWHLTSDGRSRGKPK